MKNILKAGFGFFLACCGVLILSFSCAVFQEQRRSDEGLRIKLDKVEISNMQMQSSIRAVHDVYARELCNRGAIEFCKGEQKK